MTHVLFGEPVNISGNSSSYSSVPIVAVPDENHVYVLWHESSGIFGSQGAGMNRERKASILYRISSDGGQTFGEIMKLYDFIAPMSLPPSVAVSPTTGRIFVCWRDVTGDDFGSIRVFFAKNAGTNESSSVALQDPAAININGQEKFRVNPPQSGRQLSGVEVAAGLGKKDALSMATIAGGMPKVAARGNSVYLLWLGIKNLLSEMQDPVYPPTRIAAECEILFRASHDGGNSFGEAIKLGSYSVRNEGLASDLRLIVSGHNSVYAIWRQFGRGEFAGSTLLRRSTDGGRTFGNPVVLDGVRYEGQPDSTQALLSDVAADSSYKAGNKDELFAIWTVREQPKQVGLRDYFVPPIENTISSQYFAKVCFDGNDNNNLPNFVNPAKIADNMYGFTDSFIRVFQDNVYMFRGGNGQEGEVFMTRSQDRGATFGPEKLVKKTRTQKDTMSFGGIRAHAVRVNDRIFAAWHNYTGEREEKQQGYHRPFTVIDFSASSTGGESFSEPVVISASEKSHSSNAHFEVCKDRIYIAWSEGKEGSPDILFRAGTVS